jgi:predicted enzyme related to lactoylglutathione lyase
MTTTNNFPRRVVNWFEIPVSNLQRSIALYGAMLDTPIEVTDFGGVPHGVISANDPQRTSGALIVDPNRAPGRGTVIYLDARDGVARCLARGVEAGAKVVQPITSIGPHGKIALIEDLDGNLIGLHEEPK